MGLRDEIAELVSGGDRRVDRPADAAPSDLTSADIANLRAAVTELQTAVLRLAEEIEARTPETG
jgi:hypothetical protein